MSGSPFSMFLREMFRLAIFEITISCSAPILNLSSAVSLISFFSRTISALLPLKSKRLASSFFAWLTAFSISIGLTWETISKEGMGARYSVNTLNRYNVNTTKDKVGPLTISYDIDTTRRRIVDDFGSKRGLGD